MRKFLMLGAAFLGTFSAARAPAQTSITGQGTITGQGAITTTTSTPPPPVNDPTAVLTANPYTITAGQSSMLTWTSANAISVTLSGATVALNGSQTVSPSVTTVYTLVATGAAGTTPYTTAVTVSISVPPPAGTPWTGILDPSRASIWTGAGADPAVITASRTWPICITVPPSGVREWQPRHAYQVGDRVSSRQQGYVWQAQNAGTSITDQPVWPTVAGGTVVDNTITWTMSPGISPLAMPYWRPGTNIADGWVILDLNGNSETAKCTASGCVLGLTGNLVEPKWTSNLNDTITEQNGGTIVWKLIQTTYDPSGTLPGNDTMNITAALADPSCNGQSKVVQLIAGTYYLTNGIRFPTAAKDEVLRGAGADQTILQVLSWSTLCGTGYFCMVGGIQDRTSYSGTGNAVGGSGLVVGGLSQGSTMIITNNWQGTAQPQVGDEGAPIFLDQRSDDVKVCEINSSGVPVGTGPCAGVPGFSMPGTPTIHTVLIHTSRSHGYQVGQCVGIQYSNRTANSTTLSYGTNTTNATNVCPAGNVLEHPGWFQITSVPDQYSFTYELATQSGLPPGGTASSAPGQGGGKVFMDPGGLVNAQTSIAVVSEGGETGRVCPGTGQTFGTAPMPACDVGDTSNLTPQEPLVIKSVIAGGTTTSAGSCPATVNGLPATCYELRDPIVWPSWRQSAHPSVWWVGRYSRHLAMEDFTMDGTRDGYGPNTSGGTGGIWLIFNVDSWVKGVRFISHNRNAVWLYDSPHVSIIDNYKGSSKGQQSTSYTWELYNESGHDLISNNICERGVECQISNLSAGSVVSYNYSIDHPFFSNLLMSGVYPSHEGGNYGLFESNDSVAVTSDNIHGSSNANTYFRSRILGDDYPRKLAPQALRINGYNRGDNSVGNIIGTSAGWAGSLGINTYFLVFFNGGKGSAGPSAMDLQSITSALRWGNYDSATKVTHWCDGVNTDPQCMGVISASLSAASGPPNGTVGQICPVNFSVGVPATASGGVGYVRLVGTNTPLPAGTSVTMIMPGTGYSTAPTSGYITMPNSIPGLGLTATGPWMGNCIGAGASTPMNVTVGPISEIPPAFPPYWGTTTPADHNLPPSFYLTAQPAFWQLKSPLQTPPWPAIGPDVTASGPLDATCDGTNGAPLLNYPTVLRGPGSPTGCDGIGHHSYQIPAQVCYNSLQDDPAYPRQVWGPITNGVWKTNLLSGGVAGVEITVANDIFSRYRPNAYYYDQESVEITGAVPDTFNGKYFIADADRTMMRFVRPAGDPTAGGTTPFNAAASTGSQVKITGIKIFNEHNCYANE